MEDISSSCDLKSIIALVRIIKCCVLTRHLDSFSKASVFMLTGCLSGPFSHTDGPTCSFYGPCSLDYFFHDLQQDKKLLNATLVILCFMFVCFGLVYFAFRCGTILCPKVHFCVVTGGYLHLKEFHGVAFTPDFQKCPPFCNIYGLIFRKNDVFFGWHSQEMTK